MNPAVAEQYAAYPADIRQKLQFLRQLVLQVATEHKAIGTVEETLKWGEPGYLAAKGSTLRLGWNSSRPDQYAVYFNCNTRLVDTFREVYGDLFQYSGNRAIVFELADAVPIDELKHCIELCLTYHEIKHLPLLGA